MRDFTIKIYGSLLEALLEKGYSFVRFDDYVKSETSDEKSEIAESQEYSAEPKANGEETLRQAQGDRTFSAKPSSLCILRHDVDLLPSNSLITARVEKNLGISGTYYFRTTPGVFNAGLIKEIESLGHEVGYHYETMDSSSGNIDKAYEEFCKNLEMFSKITTVKTICMHGSPLSEFDNKGIWAQRDDSGTKYSYKDLGIIGEPYFDIDWHQFAYLTDTGRRWNGSDVSVRDKVESKFKFNFKSTKDIIHNIDTLPDHIMITVHPQRWTNSYFAWSKELVMQNVKNVVKRFIVMKEDF